MKITTAGLIRWSGLAAVAGGSLYIAIQALHPLDVLSSVTTSRWAIVHYMGIAMCIFNLIGITGIYARQAEKAGWLGLIGFLTFGLFWILSGAFQFVEAFLSPILATQAPQFVKGFLGIVNGTPSAVNLGALPTVYLFTGFVGYMLGGLIFGISTVRAGILPRWAAALLAVGAILPLASPLLHHPLDRLFALPMGFALASLGYALWSERREQASQPVADMASPQLRPIAAE